MGSLAEFFEGVGRVVVPGGSPKVCRTLAGELRRSGPNRMRISVGEAPDGRCPKKDWVAFRIEGAEGDLRASHARHLYAFARWLVEVRAGDPASRWRRRRPIRTAFLWQRPVFDLYFAQSARSVRNLDREAYVREMARLGFTHLEVNGLAFPEAIEEGVPGEVYPRFYTYLPALDQFVTSRLNRGIYPGEYHRANLARLTENATLAERYGLVPTLCCFEPRSVPEALLAKYPELRGCRVDHPFRSFRPRYNLAVSHPVVREHYRELVGKLLRKVPALGCLSVWTNDSGAGLEFTRSLYAGANGSAYLVREWSAEDVFARAAADNATGFLRLLQEAAAEVNPEFRVVTRLEPFGPERARVLERLGRGLDVEAPTLLAEGWDSPYRHPRYADSRIGPFSVYNNRFEEAERAPMRRLARRGCRTHVMVAPGPVNSFEPLFGIPSPWLTLEKLGALRRAGADYLSHLGGIVPPGAAPFQPNQEVLRRFSFDPKRVPEALVRSVAAGFAGEADADALVEAWRLVEEAIRGFMPNPLYFHWGVWYRIWIRPLVPDIEAIPERERAYYERHLLATHHNPNRVDLSRDVLFRLVSPEEAERAVTRIDANALPALVRARAHLAGREGTPVFRDLADRVDALRCWMTTRRNVAAWVVHTYGYTCSADKKERSRARKALAAMVRSEIENTRALLALLARTDAELMAISEGEETTFLYDARFPEHLERKIALMERYGDRPPRIDHDILWRVKNLP
jgi:hypothetical protein